MVYKVLSDKTYLSLGLLSHTECSSFLRLIVLALTVLANGHIMRRWRSSCSLVTDDWTDGCAPESVGTLCIYIYVS